LKDEGVHLSLERQNNSNLKGQLQSSSNLADQYKQELVTIKDNIAREKNSHKKQLCDLEIKLKTEHYKEITDKEDMIAQLEMGLEEKKIQLNEAVKSLKDCKSKLVELQHKREEEALLSFQVKKKVTDPGSKLHKWLLELQHVNESKHQQLHQQQLSYTNVFKLQEANTSALQTQILDLKKKSGIQRHQLEKSYFLNALKSSYSELQELFYGREEKLKTQEQEISILQKLLDHKNSLQENFIKDLNSKEGSLKQKDEELQIQKKQHADELNKLHAQYTREVENLCKDNQMYKSHTTSQKEFCRLLETENQYKSDLVDNTEESFRKQENEIKALLKEQKTFKKQLNHLEANMKEKMKYIEKLEKKNCDVQYYYSITWYSYMSLPVSRLIGLVLLLLKTMCS